MPQPHDPVICTFADGHEERGTIVFQRNAPPTYTVAEAYSVRLDSRAHRPGYTGTMFAADKVRLVNEVDAIVERLLRQYPMLFQDRMDVLLHVFSGGTGFEWSGPRLVLVFGEQTDEELAERRAARAQEWGAQHGAPLSPETKARIDAALEIALATRRKMTAEDHAREAERRAECEAIRAFRATPEEKKRAAASSISAWSSLARVPDDVAADWRTAAIEVAEFIVAQPKDWSERLLPTEGRAARSLGIAWGVASDLLAKLSRGA